MRDYIPDLGEERCEAGVRCADHDRVPGRQAERPRDGMGDDRVSAATDPCGSEDGATMSTSASRRLPSGATVATSEESSRATGTENGAERASPSAGTGEAAACPGPGAAVPPRGDDPPRPPREDVGVPAAGTRPAACAASGAYAN